MGKKISAIPSVERQFNLCAFLLREHEPVSLRTIINEVEGYSPGKDYDSNRKMFQRDRKELEELGVKVRNEKVYDPISGRTTDGYTIDEEDFYLPKINFTVGEIAALGELAGQTAAAESAFPEVEWALMKLTGSPGDSPGGGNILMQFEQGGRRVDQKKLDTVRRAVTARKTLEIKYRSVNSGRTSRRKVDPYGMFLRSGLWYLYAFCHLRREERTFRLDRLELAGKQGTESGPDFELPGDFSMAESIGRRAPWEFGGDPVTEVELRFSPDVYWRVRNLWGGLDSVECHDSSASMRIRSINDSALLQWILEYGNDVEIVSPPALRKKMVSILGKILQNSRV